MGNAAAIDPNPNAITRRTILIGYRILMRDFSLGHTLALFVSLLLYGGALVLLPRISARGGRA